MATNFSETAAAKEAYSYHRIDDNAAPEISFNELLQLSHLP